MQRHKKGRQHKATGSLIPGKFASKFYSTMSNIQKLLFFFLNNGSAIEAFLCSRFNLRYIFATKHKKPGRKKQHPRTNASGPLCVYLSNLESELELFGRLDKEPQALLHHVGSRGAREMSCDDEKLLARWRSVLSKREQLTGFKSAIYERRQKQ